MSKLLTILAMLATMVTATAASKVNITTITLKTAAYLDGSPLNRAGVTTPSKTTAPGGMPVFCAVVPPDGTEVVRWSLLLADGSLQPITGTEGKLSIVVSVAADWGSATVVAELRTIPAPEEKPKKGLILLLR